MSRVPAWLIGLAAAGFVLITDDYIIAGVLPEIADEFSVSESTVGQLVTVFALTAAVSAPLMAWWGRRWNRRTVLPLALVGFSLANLGIALAPTLEIIFGLRVLAAFCAAVVVPTLPALAGQLAPPGRKGTFAAVVSLGTAVAIVVGLPSGTWIGTTFGWRWTFGFLAVLGACAAVFVRVSLPSVRFRAPAVRVPDSRVFDRVTVALIAIQNLVMMAMMVVLIYLAPFAAEVADAGPELRAVMFAVAGTAGVAGLLAAGRLSDRWQTRRMLVIGVAGMALMLAALALAAVLRPIPFVAMVVIAALWGFAAFWNSPPAQVEINARAGDRANEVFAVSNTATYLCIAVASAAGGVILSALGAGWLPVAGLGAAVVALVLAVVVLPSAARQAR